MLCESARQRYLIALYQWNLAVKAQRPSTTYALRFRLSALETALHMAKRYHLLLSRQGLRLQAAYRGVPSNNQTLHNLREAESQVLKRPPSVHDHFLLQEILISRSDFQNSILKYWITSNL